jgi:tetratricopeptide (TPR) repeat protein
VGFFNNAGVAAVRAGKVDEGLRLYDTALAALKTAANRHQILFNKALALRKKGDPGEAIKVLRKAVKLATSFEKASKLLAALEEEDDRRA